MYIIHRITYTCHVIPVRRGVRGQAAVGIAITTQYNNSLQQHHFVDNSLQQTAECSPIDAARQL